MATPGKSVLLDTSVVVRHFRDGNALVSHLAAFEELYLPQAALAELYAGAFRSARPEKNIQQIQRFLEAVDVLLPDESTPELYGRISAQLA
jgi:tRNA(fMet)-specific endonuclease VapC